MSTFGSQLASHPVFGLAARAVAATAAVVTGPAKRDIDSEIKHLRSLYEKWNGVEQEALGRKEEARLSYQSQFDPIRADVKAAQEELTTATAQLENDPTAANVRRFAKAQEAHRQSLALVEGLEISDRHSPTFWGRHQNSADSAAESKFWQALREFDNRTYETPGAPLRVSTKSTRYHIQEHIDAAVRAAHSAERVRALGGKPVNVGMR